MRQSLQVFTCFIAVPEQVNFQSSLEGREPGELPDGQCMAAHSTVWGQPHQTPSFLPTTLVAATGVADSAHHAAVSGEGA